MSESNSKDGFSVSRRSFLKTFGTTAAVAATAQVDAVAAELEKVNKEKIIGPEAVPITLQVNGKAIKLQVEPRVTLLEALRNLTPLTGAEEVCDRATCGACSVMIDDKLVYSCSTLAIVSQGKKITTVEGLAQNGKLSPVQQAFVEKDALMCGYCTPGFVMASVALLEKNPAPTPEQIRKGLDGNICRCGTFSRIFEAVSSVKGVTRG